MGVIMATLSCSPDEAFNLISWQSQHEYRKLVGGRIEIAIRASTFPARRTRRPGRALTA